LQHNNFIHLIFLSAIFVTLFMKIVPSLLCRSFLLYKLLFLPKN